MENVYYPSKKATLDSIHYLWRILWPLTNDVVQEHLRGILHYVENSNEES